MCINNKHAEKQNAGLVVHVLKPVAEGVDDTKKI